jgi:hypothetical protein
MRLMPALAGLLLVVHSEPARASSADALACSLRVGMVLEYASNGEAQPPWRVDSLRLGAAWGGRDSCVVLRLAIGDSRPSFQERILRREGDVQLGWDPPSASWRPQRPLATGRTVEVPRPRGRTMRFTVEGSAADTVSGRRYATLITTAVTLDSLGRATDRLRERYAPALATAVWGVFERVDSTAASGWKAQREFRLARIR